MAGCLKKMAGCLISPVEEIGKCILTQCLWPPIKSHFDYWWCFHNNIQGLSDEVRELDRQIYDLKQKIEEARLRLEVVRPGVEEWLEASTEKLAQARRILPADNIPKACNLISRYSLGKNANETTQEIAKLRNHGNFNPMADPAPPPAMRFTSHRSTMEFESRKSIEKDIIDSLKKSSVGMIGICGMGGVGKTTMAQRIVKRVKEENLFDEVLMVTISQKIDMLKIQGEIAEWLDLKIDLKHMSTRAAKLRQRLMDSKRKLIIFDDVWDSLQLDELGVPFEGERERCKILLTTRSTDVCQTMQAQKIIAMKILTEEEAWILFKDKAGDCVEDSTYFSVAKNVVLECKCLPIALVTVGKALRNRKQIFWEQSLTQLRKSNPRDFPDVLTHVYKPLKLSYDCLDESEQYLFLLCCLFPEDYNISVELLTWYSIGLQLFDDITNIEEARNHTHILVEKLQSRFLLIDVENDDEIQVKMHDVVRDVAIYIGSREKVGFLKSLPSTSIENSSDINCNWMSMDISNGRMEVPLGLRFPKLRLLMLLKSSSNQFSDISFKGMKDLNVLSFQSTSIESLPPTLGLLQNLQTLCLFRCKVQNISVIGELTSLKILSCCECQNIAELPAEIGSLSGLRLLELSHCRLLQTIPWGVISSLRGLEELKMRRSFSGWEAEENGKERRNASLTELECLPSLSRLEIEIDNPTLSAKEICLSLNLVKYYIRIGSFPYYYAERSEKVMILNLPSAVGNWIRLLARKAESLTLGGNGSVNINLAESKNLRYLSLRGCSTVKKLVDTSDLNQNVSLSNLKSLLIDDCANLKHLFSVSVARTGLLQLESLIINSCAAMEQVFCNEIRDDTDGCIEFPKLKNLRLFCLPNLTAFFQGLENTIIKFPNLTKMLIDGLPKLNSLCPLNSETLDWHDHNTCFHYLCNPKVELGCLKDLHLNDVTDIIRNVWCHQIPNNVFINLEALEICYVNRIRSLMSTSIAKNLVSLKKLLITDCKEMVEVIERDDDDKQVVVINCLFPNLRTLNIWGLDKLRWFWQWNHVLELPLLEEVGIYKCLVMETFTLGYLNTPNIRRVYVSNYREIDDWKDLNDAVHQSNKTWRQNKDKGKNEDVDENENKDEEHGYEEESKDDQDHIRTISQKSEEV